jgi:DnaJ-class molecular chaperone
MKWTNIEFGHINRIDELSNLSAFELLEVSNSVTEEDLKIAYRKKIKIYHPDNADPFMKQHDEEVMKLINNAYRTIKKELGYEN